MFGDKSMEKAILIHFDSVTGELHVEALDLKDSIALKQLSHLKKLWV